MLRCLNSKKPIALNSNGYMNSSDTKHTNKKSSVNPPRLSIYIDFHIKLA